jgi:ABC-type sugar transport system ATPase subunit
MSGLDFVGISKSFGAVRALRDVTFSVERGGAHALVGENGAGKSTLMKVLAGITRADAGEVRWGGERLDLPTPRRALDQGIGMVYQETVLFPNLTVTENIFAGRERKDAVGRLRKREMEERTAELIAGLHLALKPHDEVGSLSSARRQLIQIARALAFDCRILILDEPTTCLTDSETDDLFRILEGLRGRGVTLIYVSHRLPEIFRLCERITVLRDGGHVGTFARNDVAPGDIVRSMVGRDLEPVASARAGEGGTRSRDPEPVLSIEGLTRRPWFADVTLAVSPGEIVGLFGLVGSGRSELAETVFGLHAPDGGTVRLRGRPVRIRNPLAAVRAGIAFAPEDRQRQSLFFNMGLRENLLLAHELARGSWRIDRREETRTAEQLVGEWRIKAPGLDSPPDRLSGGNQQKVALARWWVTRPGLLILDEPTKGVDVGAKYEIHERVRAEVSGGMGCLLISSDLPEVLALAHHVVVLREGRVQGELPSSDATEEAVMKLATAVRH